MFKLNFETPVTKLSLIAAEIYRTTDFLRRKFKIKKIFEFLDNQTKILIIFGSYAKGIATEESDLDILTIGKKIEQKSAEEIERIYGIKVSPIHLNEKSFFALQKKKEPFFKEILSSHIILKGFEFFVESTWRNFYGF